MGFYDDNRVGIQIPCQDNKYFSDMIVLMGRTEKKRMLMSLVKTTDFLYEEGIHDVTFSKQDNKGFKTYPRRC